MMKFSQKNIIFLILITLSLNLSCGESPTNNPISNTGNIAFLVLGSIVFNYESKVVKIAEPDINTNYLTLYSSKNESKGATSLVIRLLVENKEQKEYLISKDNSITLSLYNGATSFKSLSGTLTITEWTSNSFIATFEASLEQIDNPQSIIVMQSGTIEINTSE